MNHKGSTEGSKAIFIATHQDTPLTIDNTLSFVLCSPLFSFNSICVNPIHGSEEGTVHESVSIDLSTSIYFKNNIGKSNSYDLCFSLSPIQWKYVTSV